MSNRTPIEVTRITGATTYTGAFRLYWILVQGTTNVVVTVQDDSAVLMTLDVPDGETVMFNFTPSVTVKISLKISWAGTGSATVAKAGA